MWFGPHVVAGALPADERPPLEAGAGLPDRGDPAHRRWAGTIDERISEGSGQSKEMTQAALIDAIRPRWRWQTLRPRQRHRAAGREGLRDALKRLKKKPGNKAAMADALA